MAEILAVLIIVGTLVGYSALKLSKAENSDYAAFVEKANGLEGRMKRAEYNIEEHGKALDAFDKSLEKVENDTGENHLDIKELAKRRPVIKVTGPIPVEIISRPKPPPVVNPTLGKIRQQMKGLSK